MKKENKKKQCKCKELLEAIKRKQGFMELRLILIYEKLREIEKNKIKL